MSREVKRVPLDFDFPWADSRRVWDGYVSPERLREDQCPDCKNGYSPYAQGLFDTWYGYVPFDPASTGSRALLHDTPGVRLFAERNIASAPWYYGADEAAIQKEGQRLADLWNGMWMHHLAQEDVDALVAGDRLWDLTHSWNPATRQRDKIEGLVLTAAQVNEWSLSGFGHDSINASVVIRARCEAADELVTCTNCDGHGTVEAYEGQRAEAEAWEATEPPEGDGWQLWETVSEGSPITPVFATAEELARWMTTHSWGSQTEKMASSYEVAMKFIDAGWAPTLIGVPGTGVVSGVEWIGSTAADWDQP
jgi:hypothetical protein